MSRRDDELRIVAIIPAAPGWWVVWRDDAGEVLDPVPAWALVEQDGFRWVQPLAPDGVGALQLTSEDRQYGDLRYFAPGAEPMKAWASDKDR